MHNRRRARSVSAIFASLAFLLSFGSPVELLAEAGPAAPDSGEIRLIIGNDAFGFAGLPEWDDFRTTAFSIEGRVHGIGLDLDYGMLTRRGDGVSEALRDDEARISVGPEIPLRPFPDLEGGGPRLLIQGALGGVAIGDLAGFELQQGFHGAVAGIARAVPSTYATQSLLLAATASLLLRGTWDFGSLGAETEAQFRIDGFGRSLVNLGARARLGGTRTGLELGFRWQGMLAPGEVGPVVAAVDAAESGLGMEARFAGPRFAFKETWNPSVPVSSGAIEVSFAGPSPETVPRNRKALEFGLPLGSDSYLLRWRSGLLRAPGGARVDVLVARASGWAREPATSFAAGLAYRFYSLLGGLDLSQTLARHPVEPFLSLAGGLRLDTVHSQPLVRATLISSDYRPAAEAELGLRLFAPAFRAGDRVGLSISCAATAPVALADLGLSARVRVVSALGD